MAGKAKSCYLTVCKKSEPHRSVFQKMFFNKGDVGKYMATEEFKEKWPPEEFVYIQETY